MARINIDNEIFLDPRFQSLSSKLGGSYAALGMLAIFWFAAQRRWGKGELLPKAEFLPDWRPLVDCNFAEEREAGFYAKGAEEHFSWYAEKCEAARIGGRASAEARRKKFGTAQPKNPERSNEPSNEIERPPNVVRERPNPPAPVPVLLISKNKNSKTEPHPPSHFPRELCTDQIQEVLVERGLSYKIFVPWMNKVVNPLWLAEKLIELHAEVDDKDFTNQKPFAVRFRQYVQASLDRLANPRYTADTTQQTDTSWRKLAGIPEEKS